MHHVFYTSACVTPAYLPSTKASHMAKAEVEEQGSVAYLRWEELQMRITKGVDTGRGDKLGQILPSTLVSQRYLQATEQFSTLSCARRGREEKARN